MFDVREGLSNIERMHKEMMGNTALNFYLKYCSGEISKSQYTELMLECTEHFYTNVLDIRKKLTDAK